MAAGGLMLMGVVPGVGEIRHASSGRQDARPWLATGIEMGPMR